MVRVTAIGKALQILSRIYNVFEVVTGLGGGGVGGGSFFFLFFLLLSIFS